MTRICSGKRLKKSWKFSIFAAFRLSSSFQFPLVHCYHIPPLLLLRVLHSFWRVKSSEISVASLDVGCFRLKFSLFVGHFESQKLLDRDLFHGRAVDTSCDRPIRPYIDQFFRVVVPTQNLRPKVPRKAKPEQFCPFLYSFLFSRQLSHQTSHPYAFVFVPI